MPSAAVQASEASVRRWLETSAKNHLAAAVGMPAILAPPPELVTNEVLRQETIRYTVQLLVAERCSLAAASGLINATAVVPWKVALATQVLDEARHVEILTDRLVALGVARDALESTVMEHAHPDVLGLSELVLRPVQAGDFLAGVLAHGLVLDEILVATYELLRAYSSVLEPGFADGARGHRRRREAAHGLRRAPGRIAAGAPAGTQARARPHAARDRRPDAQARSTRRFAKTRWRTSCAASCGPATAVPP